MTAKLRSSSIIRAPIMPLKIGMPNEKLIMSERGGLVTALQFLVLPLLLTLFVEPSYSKKLIFHEFSTIFGGLGMVILLGWARYRYFYWIFFSNLDKIVFAEFFVFDMIFDIEFDIDILYCRIFCIRYDF